MFIHCGRHTVPLHSSDDGNLFCPACEYEEVMREKNYTKPLPQPEEKPTRIQISSENKKWT